MPTPETATAAALKTTLHGPITSATIPAMRDIAKILRVPALPYLSDNTEIRRANAPAARV